MKKHFIAFFLFLSIAVTLSAANTVVLNPKTGLSLNNNSTITKLTLTDTTTTMYFHTKYVPGWWISIPKETYIQPNGGEKIYIKRTEGIPLNEQYTMPASGEVDYALIFPNIPKTTEYIDYGEANEGGSWFIYDIEIKPTKTMTQLPKELNGNWFDKTTGQWEFGFYDKYVIYKNKLWNYSFPKNKKSSNSIKLISNGEMVDVFYKIAAPGDIMLGLSTQSLKRYSNNATEATKIRPIDDKPYELPVFKVDSAIYSGYIKNYTKRTGMTTISVSVDDIITGMQSSYVTRIDENGYFSIKLPYYYPHMCWVRSSLYNGSVFLEPGKKLFQLINSSNHQSLYMGELAKINFDVERLHDLRSFDYRYMQSHILDMSPNQYKAYVEACRIKDVNSLDSIMKTNTMAAKAYQVSKMDFEYDYAASKMFYDYYWESAYREKNKIPRTQKTLTVKSDSLTAEYFDFLKNEAVNNPLAVICSGYNSFINRLKYLEILRDVNTYSYDTKNIASDLEKSGYTLTDSEKLLVEKTKELELINNSAEEKIYNEKYAQRTNDFYQKYQEKIQKLYKDNPKADVASYNGYFKENNIILTDDEELLLAAMIEHSKSESAKKTAQFYTLYSDSLNVLYKKYNEIMNEQFSITRMKNRDEKLNRLLNIQPGFCRDVIIAQDYCQKIVEEISPVNPEKLANIQHQLNDPFIVDYVALCNNRAIAKLEANKKKTGFMINETPKAEADKIFEAIINKYKGKVIYVDFWATWCGPCRSGIEQIKPLKEDLAGKDIVFVYITNPSSPQSTWSNMIPDIKGEHFRVSQDEWNFLAAKFNITGIPHYVLVGKDGNVINSALGHYDNSQLKSILEKQIKE